MTTLEQLKDNKLAKALNKFSKYFEGEIHTEDAFRLMYASDAGLYHMIPDAVVYPKSEKDLINLVIFAKQNETNLIPRTAGTSLGGQCVGNGIVVDVSRFMTNIIEFNAEEKWIKVQPGVIRDDLNVFLKPFGLHFGPNTSTSNRAMIGGMVGNNSSGSYSIKYGTTRENVSSVKGVLSDGSIAVFEDLETEDFREKTRGTTLENAIYRQIAFELSHPLTQEHIKKEFPEKNVTRRNTGYAVDQLLDSDVFEQSDKPFNFSKLLCGSEGTLMLFSEITLKLVPLPTENIALICAHFDDLDKSLNGAVEAMKLHPNQCELMDKIILDCTKDNILQAQNRFFIKGDPAAILMIEVEQKENSSLSEEIEKMIHCFESKNLIYDHTVLYGNDIKKALHLRASGLGVLQNIQSESKPLEFVEDTAVAIDKLPEYIKDFEQIMVNNSTESVYYAHAGAGELHIRPKVNLKTKEGVAHFRKIAEESAHLVKKYNGSLSGEHGDGRVRSEFIPIVLGPRNYELLKRIKNTWDPLNIFNPGKIVNPDKMDANLKHFVETPYQSPEVVMNFEKEGSFLQALEKCSGSGDCRKTEVIGGTLCPSYMATRNEKDTTRARARILRDYIVYGDKEVFNNSNIKEVLDLCLSCKACISECPSSVDMASIKASYLNEYLKHNPATFSHRVYANFYKISKKIAPFAPLLNIINQNPLLNWLPKKIMKLNSRRSLPIYSHQTFEHWVQKKHKDLISKNASVYLLCDEFSNYLDSEIAQKVLLVLKKLNIEFSVLPVMDSARSFISKGFLEEAKITINQNLEELKHLVQEDAIIIGIEPSSILGFKDDYKRLVNANNKEFLENISKNTMTIEEFIAYQIDNNLISQDLFTEEKLEILYHGHCHQKSLSKTDFALKMLNFPKNYLAKEIPSGCCGMAGSFGFEQIDLSFQIGDLVLFPSIRKASDKTIISASGTSCRHQIKDGVSKKAFHPIEIFYNALKFPKK